MGILKKVYNAFNGEKNEEKINDFSAKWNSWEEFEKHIVVVPNNSIIRNSVFAIDGIKHDDEICTFDILAVDRKILKKNSSQIFQKNIDELTCGSVLFFGGAGSYKTANIIKPTILKNILCENTPSMIVTDPKGELFDSTSYYAQQKGYKVYRFNPSNYINSHKWNPLTDIHKIFMSYKKALDADKQIKFLAKLDKKINFLINAIAPVPDNAGTNSFFYEQARVYLIGFIYLFLEINTNVDDFNLFNIASNVKLIAKKIGIIYDNLSAFSLCKKYLKDFSYDDMHLGNQTTSQDSVLSMVNNYLSPFLNQNIRMATLFSEIDFRYFVDGRAIVYVQVEATSSKDSPTNKLSILFMNNLYDFLNDYLNDNQISSFKNSVLYIIDEFGNMPRMEFISKIFSLDRAKNIFAIISVQSKSQILEIYGPHRTQELIDSAQCLIICSLDDVNFAQELSRRSGKVIRKSYSISEQESGKDEEFTKSKTQSESESQVEAIEAHEFINKKQNEFIIFLRGISPIKIEFIPFWETTFGKSFIDKNINITLNKPENFTIETINYFDKYFPKKILNAWVEKHIKEEKTYRQFVAKSYENILIKSNSKFVKNVENDENNLNNLI